MDNLKPYLKLGFHNAALILGGVASYFALKHMSHTKQSVVSEIVQVSLCASLYAQLFQTRHLHDYADEPLLVLFGGKLIAGYICGLIVCSAIRPAIEHTF